MRSKEELLKIYSAYLPYELTFYPSEKSNLFDDLFADNFKHSAWNYRLALEENDIDAIRISKSFLIQKTPFITFEENELFLGQFESSLGFDVDDVFASEVKPILYSMDMLTKEIEHKGERFIPSIEIEKHTITGGTYNWHAVKLENLRYLNYEVVQKLFEWHFNLFGLDESEYIKKETLTL